MKFIIFAIGIIFTAPVFSVAKASTVHHLVCDSFSLQRYANAGSPDDIDMCKAGEVDCSNWQMDFIDRIWVQNPEFDYSQIQAELKTSLGTHRLVFYFPASLERPVDEYSAGRNHVPFLSTRVNRFRLMSVETTNGREFTITLANTAPQRLLPYGILKCNKGL